MPIDKEDWIMEKANELALKEVGIDFNSLPSDRQYQYFSKAEQDYAEMQMAMAEARFDMAYENKEIENCL